jgi:redox-sensitive bicupin YhaK (pirin superfamily)
VQTISPGAVNWMTAGKGIVHSERTAQDLRKTGSALFGLQCWVALPQRFEEADPSFSHTAADKLPVIEGDGAVARIIAGSFFGQTSPVATLSDMFYVDLTLHAGARLTMPSTYTEQALYVVNGMLDLGAAGSFGPGQLLVLKPGATVTLGTLDAAGARVMLLGGEPMDGPRYLSWNFVASSAERIEQAKREWDAQTFPKIPGESECLPLPDLPGKPVRYP